MPASAHLKILREFELDRVAHFFPVHGQILEIGAGSGWQAQKLSQRGFQVAAVDISESPYEPDCFPVQLYDGRTLPFPDRHFDAIFTSSMLEHVRDIHEFLQETARVLKPSGVAVHILPNSSWRFWMLFAHYLNIAKSLALACTGLHGANEPTSVSTNRRPKRSLVTRLMRVAFPPRHGERGNCLTEILLFHPSHWRKIFEQAGWGIESVEPAGAFYTGHELLAGALPLTRRKWLSRYLGSACTIYVLRRAAAR